MGVHALMTVVAAFFGYVVVIALRETLVAALGRRWFAVASPWVQVALIVSLGSSLLLLPAASDRVGRDGFEDWRALSPPMWFLGAYEVATRGAIADLRRSVMTLRKEGDDRVTSALYARRRGQFPAMARRAVMAVGVIFLLGAAAYLWNARRLPSLAALPPPAFRRPSALRAWLARTLIARHPATRAGFDLTLAVMWRSNTHRLTLACAAAAGFAMAVLALSNASAQQSAGPSPRLLSMQPLLYGALLIGFRHIIRVPAELRANWGFQLAWAGRERAFMAGVRRAAILALAVPALAVLLPLFMFVMGPWPALAHAALGCAGAVVMLEALMVNYDKVPFTCTYLPSENMKAMAPVYGFAFIIGASIFAQMQNTALQSGNPARLLITLAALFAILRMMSRTRQRLPAIEFDEAPVTYQQLGLHRN
jgi:hypothetical protein